MTKNQSDRVPLYYQIRVGGAQGLCMDYQHPCHFLCSNSVIYQKHGDMALVLLLVTALEGCYNRYPSGAYVEYHWCSAGRMNGCKVAVEVPEQPYITRTFPATTPHSLFRKTVCRIRYGATGLRSACHFPARELGSKTAAAVTWRKWSCESGLKGVEFSRDPVLVEPAHAVSRVPYALTWCLWFPRA